MYHLHSAKSFVSLPGGLE